MMPVTMGTIDTARRSTVRDAVTGTEVKRLVYGENTHMKNNSTIIVLM